MPQVPHVVILGLKNSCLDLPLSFEFIDNIKALPQKKCFAVIIDLDYVRDSLKATLYALRQMPSYQLLPLFYLGSLNPEDALFFDGPLDYEAIAIGQAIHQRMQCLTENIANKNEVELRILQYLYVRPQLKLEVCMDYHFEAGFNYPLMEIFLPNTKAAHYWPLLNNMSTRDLIKQEKLVNELKICPHCETALLNFKNCCPACLASEIKNQQSVHCFACGKLGPLSDFLRAERLYCPRCAIPLRHLGIDYDKPIEDMVCLECKHYFIEAEIRVSCLVCGKVAAVWDLKSRPLYHYSLAKRSDYLLSGSEQNLYGDLNQWFEFLSLTNFMQVLVWQIKLAKRYKEVHFSLCGLQILNEEALINAFGFLPAEKFFMEFFEELRILFRDSDLVTKDKGIVLFFLPMTASQSCPVILKKLLDFVKKRKPLQNKIPIKIGIGFLSSEEIIKNEIAHDAIISHLRENLRLN